MDFTQTLGSTRRSRHVKCIFPKDAANSTDILPKESAAALYSNGSLHDDYPAVYSMRGHLYQNEKSKANGGHLSFCESIRAQGETAQIAAPRLSSTKRRNPWLSLCPLIVGTVQRNSSQP